MERFGIRVTALVVATVVLTACQSAPRVPLLNAGPPSVPELLQYREATYTNTLTLAPQTLPVRSIAYLESNRDIVSIPPMEAYIRDVMRDVLEIAPVTSLDPVTLNVVITSDPTTKAFINPYGDIVISLGALERMRSRGELVFLLSLEVAHAALGHFERDRFALGFDRLLDALKFVAIAQEFAAAIIEDRAGSLSAFANDPQIQIKVRQLLIAATAAELLLEGFVGPQWRSSQEAEADRFALDVMLTLGYNPTVAQQVFGRFGEASQEQIEQLQDMVYTIRDLVLEIQDLAGQNQGVRGLVVSFVTDLSFRFAARSISGLSRIYGTPEERFADLRDYVDVAYTLGRVPIPEIARRAPTDDFEAAKRNPVYQRAVREVTGPWDALAEFTRLQSEARDSEAPGTGGGTAPPDTILARIANGLVNSLLRYAGVPAQTTQYPRLVYAENAAAQDQLGEAIAQLSRARTARNAGPAIPAALVGFLAQDGQYARARETIDLLERRFPGDGTQFPLRMVVAHEEGDIELRDDLAQQCNSEDVARFIDDRCELLEARYRMADRFQRTAETGEVEPADDGDAPEDAGEEEGGGILDQLRGIRLPGLGS